MRALYDFTPTEQGELGFQKGDIIRVIESVYRDWWKGELRGEMGIFPVNYVVSNKGRQGVVYANDGMFRKNCMILHQLI